MSIPSRIFGALLIAGALGTSPQGQAGTSPSAATPNLVVSRMQPQSAIDLHPHLSLWLADRADTDLKRAVEAFQEGKFKAPNHILSLHDLMSNPHSYWLRIPLRNADHPTETWRLEFADAKAQSINVFSMQGDRVVEEEEDLTIEEGPGTGWGLLNYPGVDVTLPMGEERVVYAQIISRSPPLLNARLLNETGTAQTQFSDRTHGRLFQSALLLATLAALVGLAVARRWIGFGIMLAMGAGILRVTLRMGQVRAFFEAWGVHDYVWHVEGTVTGFWMLATAWVIYAFATHRRVPARGDKLLLLAAAAFAAVAAANLVVSAPPVMLLSIANVGFCLAVLAYTINGVKAAVPYAAYVWAGIMPLALLSLQGAIAPGLQNVFGFGELPSLYAQVFLSLALLAGLVSQTVDRFVREGGMAAFPAAARSPRAAAPRALVPEVPIGAEAWEAGMDAVVVPLPRSEQNDTEDARKSA